MKSNTLISSNISYDKKIFNNISSFYSIIDKTYLNDVSLKYRYDLIHINKINNEIGSKIHTNLFHNPPEYRNTHIDKDIRLGVTQLQDIKNESMIETKPEKDNPNRSSILMNTINNRIENSFTEKNEKDSNKNIETNNLKKTDDQKNENKSPKIKKIKLKIPKHNRDFIIYNKDKNMKNLFSDKKIIKKHNGIMKHPIKKNFILKLNNLSSDSPVIQSENNISDNEVNEYSNIYSNRSSDIQLFKNYLSSQRNISTLNVNNVIKVNNGKISLHKLTESKDYKNDIIKDQKYQVEMINSADGQAIYSLVKNKKEVKKFIKKDAISVKIDNKNLKRNNSLILPNVNPYLNQNISNNEPYHDEISEIKKKNLECLEDSKKKQKKKFAKIVMSNKIRLQNIQKKINNIIFSTSTINEKIDRIRIRKLFFPVKKKETKL